MTRCFQEEEITKKDLKIILLLEKKNSLQY